MSNKKLEIQTKQVEIKVVKIGGSKMTISVFKQIQNAYLFNSKLEPWFDDVLGYINREGRYILWQSEGKLFKTEISGLFKLENYLDDKNKINGSTLNTWIRNFNKISNLRLPKVYNSYSDHAIENHEVNNIYQEFETKIFDVLKDLDQLYIAT